MPISLGTWYPKRNVLWLWKGCTNWRWNWASEFRFNCNVTSIEVENGRATEVVVEDGGRYTADVIGGADYHFIETKLLPGNYRRYRINIGISVSMAPSCLFILCWFEPEDRRCSSSPLFFDADFDVHGKRYTAASNGPSDPLFYLSVSSVTDETVAPAGCDNMVFLIPIAAGLAGDAETLREEYFQRILSRFEAKTGQSIRDPYRIQEKLFVKAIFIDDYNSFQGNAHGLANTLMQTAVFRPSCRSIKIKPIFTPGNLPFRGPGYRPALISGEVVANEVLKHFGKPVVDKVMV